MRQLKITKNFTNRDTISFKHYLTEVSKIPLIKDNEEVELAIRIKEGDEIAINKLISSNLRFVISVAKQYVDSDSTLEDLVTEGNIGLCIAAKKYDHTMGNKFISYAVWWIRRTILDYKSNQSKTIRIPTNKITDMFKIKNLISDLEQRLERSPSADEIAEEGNYDISTVELILSLNTRDVTSLDNCINEDGNTLGDLIEDTTSPSADHLVTTEESVSKIEILLGSMKSQERYIVECYYGLRGDEKISMSEIGLELGLSRERVRQIKDRAIHNLKYKLVRFGLFNNYND
jgi:RNA polymerase primary sigma factor